MLCDAIENRLHRRGLHQRRRAAAEKNTRYGAPGRSRGCRSDLDFIGANETRFIDATVTDVTIEVAIWTLRQAERPVHVDGKRCC